MSIIYEHNFFGPAMKSTFCRVDRPYSDVALKSNLCDLTISAHRILLAACSKHMEKLFNKDVKREIVEVRNVDHNTLFAVVQFIYNGQIELKSTDEDEDFRAAMRSLNIRLSDEVNAIIFEDAPPPAARPSSKLPLRSKVKSSKSRTKKQAPSTCTS